MMYVCSGTRLAHHLARIHDFESQELPWCHSSGINCVGDAVGQDEPDTYSVCVCSRNDSNMAKDLKLATAKSSTDFQ
jgi:hypothetical protein